MVKKKGQNIVRVKFYTVILNVRVKFYTVIYLSNFFLSILSIKIIPITDKYQ